VLGSRIPVARPLANDGDEPPLGGDPDEEHHAVPGRTTKADGDAEQL
jgi:1-deoxy-D-xylulose-5-phosphate synthase